METAKTLIFRIFCFVSLFTLVCFMASAATAGASSGTPFLVYFCLAFAAAGITVPVFGRKSFFGKTGESISSAYPMIIILALNILIKAIAQVMMFGTVSMNVLFVPLITTVICLLVFLMARTLFSKRLSFLAALIYALGPGFFSGETVNYRLLFTSLLLCLSVFFLVASTDKRSVQFGGRVKSGGPGKVVFPIMAALFFTLAYLLSGLSVFLLPGMIIYPFIISHPKGKKDRFCSEFLFPICVLVMPAIAETILYFTKGTLFASMPELSPIFNGSVTDFNWILTFFGERVKDFWSDIFSLTGNLRLWSLVFMLYLFFGAVLGAFSSSKLKRRETVIYVMYPTVIFVCCLIFNGIFRNLWIMMPIFSVLASYGLGGTFEFAVVTDRVKEPSQNHETKSEPVHETVHEPACQPERAHGESLFTEISDDTDYTDEVLSDGVAYTEEPDLEEKVISEEETIPAETKEDEPSVHNHTEEVTPNNSVVLNVLSALDTSKQKPAFVYEEEAHRTLLFDEETEKKTTYSLKECGDLAYRKLRIAYWRNHIKAIRNR